MPETHSERGHTAPLQWVDDRSSQCIALEGDGSRCLHTGGTSGGHLAAPPSPDTVCRRGADSTGGGGLLTLECTGHRGGRGQWKRSPLPPSQTGCSPLEQTGQVDHRRLPLYLRTARPHTGSEWPCSVASSTWSVKSAQLTCVVCSHCCVGCSAEWNGCTTC